MRLTQWLEAEFRTPGRQRFDNAADVVADQTEARRLGLAFHGAAQGGLGRTRHRVGLVQNDDLERRTRSTTIQIK